MEIEFRIDRAPFSSAELEIRVRTRDCFMKPAVFSVPKTGAHVEPALKIRPSEAQQLMDELWRSGLRPTEGTGSAGSLAATQSHLEDMKKIAFHQLKIK